MQFAVDGVGQAELPHQELEGAEAAGVEAPGLLADLVVDVGVAEQAAALLRPLPRAQPPPDAAPAIAQAPPYLVLHYKHLPARGAGCSVVGARGVPPPSPGRRPPLN